MSGTVSLDGEPIVGSRELRATVSFYREGGTNAPAVGIVDAQGRYSLSTASSQRVEPGIYLVSISATRIHIPQEKSATPSGTPITPRRYANANESGFRVEVKRGENEFDFDMTSE